jgi:hypothetical protein
VNEVQQAARGMAVVVVDNRADREEVTMKPTGGTSP